MNKHPTIFLTGKNGQVGWELERTLAPMGKVVALDIEDLDLTDEKKIRETVRAVKPSLIVNPAAYTAVDKAEEEPELARAINRLAPTILAEEAKRLQIPICHFSTDYVFDGEKKEPYTEEDEPNPINVYGKTKLHGERGVQGSGSRHLILRLSWVYGLRGNNFLLTMLKLAKEKKEIRVVNDQFGAPTWSRMIAEATAMIAHRILSGVEWEDGVYHLPSAGKTTWFGFADRIFDRLDSNHIDNIPKLIPISSAEYPTAARRPPNSVMSGEKIGRKFGVELPPWDVSLNLASS